MEFVTGMIIGFIIGAGLTLLTTSMCRVAKDDCALCAYYPKNEEEPDDSEEDDE